MTKTKAFPSSPQHEELQRELLAVIARFGATMPGDEILAVVCVLVGKLTAMQDQRRFTPEMVMSIVSANIQAGNDLMVKSLRDGVAGHA